MATRKFKIKIENKVFEAEVEEIGGAPVVTAAAPAPRPVAASAPAAPAPVAGANTVVAPMPGKVISVKVSKGQQVNAGDTVLILEAMKMEQEIKAAAAGTVVDIPVSDGQSVTKNQPLIILG